MEYDLVQPNKWVMNVAGVLNYWYYKYEVFPFENGHLLIRGTNGSGKSVTTQSFLPLLLDGNKQPSRLDPFGSRSRKIIDYIFGENPDVTEKTSYIFLEYKKKNTEEYITTGIGFKANIDNGNVHSWHFVIKNKRIGKDFDLFKTQLDEQGEKVMVPLSQKELENYVENEKCGYVKEKPRDYAELVNKYIFKFESLEDYLDMVNLVVLIRTPKLTNNLGPNVIYDILESSLPEITFNDLRSLTETIQNIDLHNEQLTKAKDDYKLLKKLVSKYQEYNQTVLSFKATDYNAALTKHKTAETDYKKATQELADTIKQLTQVLEEMTDLELEGKQLEERLRIFEDNDIRKVQRQLTELKPQLEQNKTSYESQKLKLQNKIDAQKSLESQLEEKMEGLFKYERKNQLISEDLNEKAAIIDFESHSLIQDNFQYNFKLQDPTIVADQWRETLKGHIEEIKGIAKLLKREEDLKSKLDERNQDINELDEELKDIENHISKLQFQLEESIDSFNYNVANWNEANQEFKLQKQELNQLISVLSALFEGTDLSDIDKLIHKFYSNLNRKLIQERAQIEASLKLIKDRIKVKEEKLEEIQNKKDPEPERDSQTLEVRKNLLKKNILFIPFYEAVEFKDFVTEDEKERLESSLREMGVLDALIVEKTQMHYVSESDSILLPQVTKEEGTLDEYLDVHLSERFKTLQSDVEAVLRSISFTEIEDGSYATPFGSYQHGSVKGYAPYRESATFIGKQARKQYREKLITTLQEELSILSKEQVGLQDALKKNADSDKQLSDEKDNFPSTRELKTQNEDIADFEKKIESINQQKVRVEKGLQSISTDYKETRSERMKKAENRELKPTLQSYEAAITECNNYDRLLDDLRFNGKNYYNVQDAIRSFKSQIIDIESDIEDKRYSCVQLERTIKGLENTIKELEEYLQKQNTDDIEREIREAEERKSQIPTLLQKKAEEKGKLSNLIPQLTKNVEDKKTFIAFYEKMKRVKGDIFVNEFNMKFIETFDRETLANEKDTELLSKAVLEEFGDSIYQNVRDKEAELNDELTDVRLKGLEGFHPTLKRTSYNLPDISNIPFDILVQEVKDMELTKQRSLISLTFDGKSTSPMVVQETLGNQIELMQAALRAEDEKMYKEIIMDRIGDRIRELISKANKWKLEINKLMSERQTSSDLQLSIEWKPKEAKELDELRTSELINLLQRDPDTLKDSDFNKLTKHFTSKIQYAKDIYEEDEENKEKALDYVIKDVLDYRKWFEFKIYYKKGEDNKSELTKNRFNGLSGGERALSMYIPLIAALFSKYGSASEEAPYIISMDEAFAGVDDDNIRDMFKLIGDLNLNYILNSQALWGDYDTIDSLSITEIIRPKNSKDVTVVRFKWNGKEILPVKEISLRDEQEDEIEPSPEQQDIFELLEV
ncbi:TIGR02680 family protein [Priestia megaterium]|uniref:TIGR02680 family protein n=1 Tax=Priestia megaterium TaxID=1404 RepID=A0A6M6DZC1_PRIMG|nr:TIGR02680 family protein [Priestia megaterium]QJX79960.1 TIGR02680 family protein [Priestia megaterium]